MKKPSAILAIVLCVALLLVGCGGGASSPLVGKWTDKDTGMTTIEFLGDGTMKMYILNELALTSTYKVDGDKLTITSEGVETQSTFKVENNELTITSTSTNQALTYKKQ